MTTSLTSEEIHFVTAGRGRPVVLVHGLAEDHRSWLPQLHGGHALNGVETVAIDLRGHGNTPLGAADGTLAQLADDLGTFLSTLSAPTIVAGFSLGGIIALESARRHPSLISHVVALGTSSVVGRRAKEFFLERIGLAEEGATEALRTALREDTALQLHGSDIDVEALTDRRMEAVGDGRGYANAARAMVGVADRPLTPSLVEIECPVTVVGATNDSFCPLKAAQMLLEALPSAQYREVSNAGHLMNVESPGRVSAIIQEAIEGRSSA